MIVQAKIISINPESNPTSEHPKAGIVYYTVRVGQYGEYQFQLPYRDLDNRYVPSDTIPVNVELHNSTQKIGFDITMSFAGDWLGVEFFDGDIEYIDKVETELWMNGKYPPDGPFDENYSYKPWGWEEWQFPEHDGTEPSGIEGDDDVPLAGEMDDFPKT